MALSVPIGSGAEFSWKWSPFQVFRRSGPGGSVSAIPNTQVSIIQDISGDSYAYTGGKTGYDTMEFKFRELFGGGVTDFQESGVFGVPIGAEDKGEFTQKGSAYANEVSKSTNPPPIPPGSGPLATRFDETGISKMTSQAWAGWIGGGWVDRAGFPKTIKPYAPGGIATFDRPPYNLAGYDKVAEYSTKFSYKTDKACKKVTCKVDWSFSLIDNGAVQKTWSQSAEKDPCPAGTTIPIP